MKVVRIIFFCLIIFLALPEMIIGFPSLADGFRAYGDTWSVRHSYFGDALFMLVPGFLAILAAGYGAFVAKRHHWIYAGISAFIVIYMAIAIPSWLISPKNRGAMAVQLKMYDLQHAADEWSSAKRVYPRTPQELAEALHIEQLDDHATSPYQRRHAPVAYETRFLNNATGPQFPTDRPGVLVYAVDSAGQHYWITGSVLPKSVSRDVIALTEGVHDQPFVLAGELPASEPKAAPAAQKTKK